MTRVSVITTFYNPTEEQIYASESGIMSQSSTDFEWVVVDDGSTSDYTGLYSIRCEKNFGPSVARNLGFQISTGNIITYLDMGDFLYKDRVKNIIELFDTYRIELLFSAYDIEPNDGKSAYIFDHFHWIGKHPKFPTAVEYMKLLQRQNISIPLGVAHTKRPFVEAGGFQRGIVCGEDGILWRRMVDRIEPTKIMFSDDRAGRYFISQDGQSRTQRRFEMGGFAFDGSRNDNGSYLDDHWFREYSSEGYYE